MIREENDGIYFSGWDSELKALRRKGYAIDYSHPCSVSPVGEIRCKLRRKEDGHAYSKS